MKQIIEIIVYCGLLFLLYQDLKYRAVYWWLFLLLPAGLLYLRLTTTPINELIWQFVINTSFLLVQMFLMWMYFGIRQRRFANLNHLIGAGDILFLITIAVYLPAINYIAFYIGSLVLVILLVFISGSLKKQENKIPLAGYQAVLLLLLMVADHAFAGVQLTSDQYLLNFIG